MEKNKTPQKIKVAGVLYEKIPERIRVEGKLYILAEGIKHKKCAKGTHWNYKQKKCMKLPPDLASQSSRAFRSSKRANNMSEFPDPGKSEMDAKKQHMLARSHHQKAWAAADKAGFKALGNKHRSFINSHSDMAAKHERRMFPGQQT